MIPKSRIYKSLVKHFRSKNLIIKYLAIGLASAYFFLHRNRLVIASGFPPFLILAAIVGSICFVYFFPRTSYASWHLTSTGQIGDTIGGLTGPIIGILNAILLWWTLREQSRQGRQQNLRSDLDKCIDAIDRQIDKTRLLGRTVIYDGNRYRVDEDRTIEYYGAEALHRARKHINDNPDPYVELPTIFSSEIDEVEWEVFLQSVQTILRRVSAALDLFDEIEEDRAKKNLDIRDMVNQVVDVTLFAKSYIAFVGKFQETSEDGSQREYVNVEVQNIYKGRLKEFYHYLGVNIS